VVLAVGHLSEILKAFFQDGRQWGLNIRYSYEDKPLGTAGPIARVPGLEETFLVTNGDVLTTLDLNELVLFHRGQNAAATIASHKRQVHIDLGVIRHDGCLVTGYDEKPTLEYVVSMGIYVFEPRVLRYIPQNEYFDFPSLVLKMIAAGERVLSYPFDGYWKDLGRPDDYEQAAEDFTRMRAQFLHGENAREEAS
jgi:NDP-sugar pyrophosphorylase family protein